MFRRPPPLAQPRSAAQSRRPWLAGMAPEGRALPAVLTIGDAAVSRDRTSDGRRDATTASE
jgi:hypothetical protein